MIGMPYRGRGVSSKNDATGTTDNHPLEAIRARALMPHFSVMIENKIERDKISIGSVTDDCDDLSYWLSKSPEERIAAFRRDGG